MANALSKVQDIVVGNKNFTDVTKPSEIVQLLLNDEQLANLDSTSTAQELTTRGDMPVEGISSVAPVRDLWNEEGDDFFRPNSGAPASLGNGTSNTPNEEEIGAPIPTGRKKRRTGVSGPRKGGKKKSVASTGVATPASIDVI